MVGRKKKFITVADNLRSAAPFWSAEEQKQNGFNACKALVSARRLTGR